MDHVHRWKVGPNVITDDIEPDGYYAGSCTTEGCLATKTWPAYPWDIAAVWRRTEKGPKRGREMEVRAE